MLVHRKVKELWVRGYELREGDFIVPVGAIITSIRKGKRAEADGKSNAEVHGHIMCRFPATLNKTHTGASFHPDSLIHVYR